MTKDLLLYFILIAWSGVEFSLVFSLQLLRFDENSKLRNVETKSQAAVTGLTAFSPVTPPPLHLPT